MKCKRQRQRGSQPLTSRYSVIQNLQKKESALDGIGSEMGMGKERVPLQPRKLPTLDTTIETAYTPHNLHGSNQIPTTITQTHSSFFPKIPLPIYLYLQHCHPVTRQDSRSCCSLPLPLQHLSDKSKAANKKKSLFICLKIIKTKAQMIIGLSIERQRRFELIIIINSTRKFWERNILFCEKITLMAPKLLSSSNFKSLFDSVDTFLFDCDGVIWKGDTLIDGVSQTLDLLRSKGKNIVFVTNNSMKSRRQYAEKFQSLGLTSVTQDEIFSSSFSAAMYLKANNFPKDKKVYVIGGEGILEELQLAGFTGLGGPEDGEKRAQWKSNCLFEHDKTVGAVVVGLDPNINYYKLQYGTLCVRENPGCLFIATNRDAVGHMTDLQEWPGAGCMVAAMCGSTEREPVVVGKPATFMMDYLIQKFGTETSRMCMVGDRLDTDVLFGQNAGCKTLLVLSGCTSESNLLDESNKIEPDYYTSMVSDITKLMDSP